MKKLPTWKTCKQKIELFKFTNLLRLNIMKEETLRIQRRMKTRNPNNKRPPPPKGAFPNSASEELQQSRDANIKKNIAQVMTNSEWI